MPHLHCVRITPDGKYLLADDLGTDQIHKFNINPNANADNKEKFSQKVPRKLLKLLPVPAPGIWYSIQTVSLPTLLMKSEDGNRFSICWRNVGRNSNCCGWHCKRTGSGDIHLSPDGKYLYASNRLKADGVAIFKVDETNGTLTKVGYQLTGIHPRNFIITPNGKYLLVACRDTNVIQIFERDQATGLLTDIKKDIKVDKPVCLKFVDW